MDTLIENQTTRKVSKVKLMKNGCAFVEYLETKVIIIDDKPVEKVLTFLMKV